jgi:hypothetical protein
MSNYEERLIGAHYQAARFLMEKCKSERWFWSSNFLREYVRCSTGLQFSNSRSPEILRTLKERYPEIKHWIATAALKGERQETADLFE